MNDPKEKNFLGKIIFSHEVLDSEELNEMVFEYQRTKNKELRYQIILKNQRLIIDTAKKYVTENSFFNIEDLSAYGTIGLMRAIDKFDGTANTKFSYYARFWIKQAIKRNIHDFARTIRIPSHKFDLIRRVVKGKKKLSHKLKRDPLSEEIAHETYLSLDKIYSLQKIAQTDLSLESDSSNSQGNEMFSLRDIVANENVLSPDQQVSNRLQSSQIKNMMEVLSSRERTIIEMRFGLNGYESMTLQEVGDEFKITRERTRQIEKMAIDKLRRYARRRNDSLVQVDLLQRDKSMGLI